MSNDANPVECATCGGMALHYRCHECGGEGEFDMYEDNPNEYEPGETEECDTCLGKGSWTVCQNPNCPTRNRKRP